MQRREPSQSRCVWKRTYVSRLLHPSERRCDRRRYHQQGSSSKSDNHNEVSYLQGTDNPWQSVKGKSDGPCDMFLMGSRLSLTLATKSTLLDKQLN